MQVADKGIVVLAQNNSLVNYVDQACVLAMSLKVTNPKAKISIITNDHVPYEYRQLFDNVLPIPWNDDAAQTEWKIENRWKIYHITPYDQTIVLDTDMLVLQDISSWWKFLEHYSLYFVSKVYTYREEIADTSYYRKAFISNRLPNLYSGFHYFEKNDVALDFYQQLEQVMHNWQSFYEKFLEPESRPTWMSVDVCAAITALILDCANDITNARARFPSFTHMKPHCQGWSERITNWQDKVGFYMSRDCSIKIGNYTQSGILHYTEKDFLERTPVVERYRNLLNV